MLKAQAIPTWPTPTMVTLLPEWATGVWISVLSFSTLVAIFLLSIIQADNQINTRVAQLKRASVSGGTTIKTGTSLTLSWYWSLTTFKMIEYGNSVKKESWKWSNVHVNTNARSRVTYMNVKLKSPWHVCPTTIVGPSCCPLDSGTAPLDFRCISSTSQAGNAKKKPEPWILQLPISMNLDLVLLQKRDY